VAAPDHQAVHSRSTLFPGIGHMEGPKSVGGAARERRGVGSENGTVVLPIRKFGGYAPEKFSKINFEIAHIFCISAN